MAETWQQWERAASGHRDSEMSLQELDPSPIESPYDSFEDKIDFPDLEKSDDKLGARPGLTQRTSTLGLSGSGHGAVYYLTRIQKYSSYAFLTFTTFHISNTSIFPLITQSIPSSDNLLLLTRPYYQSAIMEPLLITLPILAHISSGVALRLIRRSQSLKRYGGLSLNVHQRFENKVRVWPQLSTTSAIGYALIPLVLGHAYINRILPLIVDGGSSSVGLGFVAHGFAKHPFVATTGYAALVSAFSGHLVWGTAKWLGVSQLSTSNTKAGKRRWWVLNGVSALVAGVWMAGGLGVVARGGLGTGWLAQIWDDIYARIPLVNF